MRSVTIVLLLSTNYKGGSQDTPRTWTGDGLAWNGALSLKCLLPVEGTSAECAFLNFEFGKRFKLGSFSHPGSWRCLGRTRKLYGSPDHSLDRDPNWSIHKEITHASD